MILILFAYMVLASTFTLGKVALEYVPPFLLIGIRMIIGGGLLLAYQYWGNFKLWRMDREHWWLLIKLTLFHVYFAYILEFWAMQYISSFKACLLFNLSPFLTAFFAYFMFSERLTLQKFVGMTIGLIGFLPILIASAPQEQALGSIGFLSVPEIVMLLSVISGSYGWILMQQCTRDEEYSPMMVNGIAMLVGGVMATMTSFIFEGYPHLIVPAGMPADTPFAELLGYAITYIAALVIIANFLFYNLYGWLLTKYSATFLSFAGFTSPLFAALFGWFFLGEVITWHFFVSIVMVFIGLYIFYKNELNQVTR